MSSQVGIWNWERWTNEEYDGLYEQGIAESDTAKRTAIYLRMQEIMEETGAYVWINHEPEILCPSRKHHDQRRALRASWTIASSATPRLEFSSRGVISARVLVTNGQGSMFM